jgi:hypothetical protein
LKTRDLDGTVNSWKISGHVVRASDERPRSQLHLKARKLLRGVYPTVQILEEVPFQLRRNQRGFLDFYINTIKTVVEVHGSQHYKFNTLYHTSVQHFVNQKKRDADLVEWCEINNLNYIELPFSENEDQWKNRILRNSN